MRFIKNRHLYFAERLHHALTRWITNNGTLIRIIVTQLEVDIEKIKIAFQKNYSKSLESWILSILYFVWKLNSFLIGFRFPEKYYWTLPDNYVKNPGLKLFNFKIFMNNFFIYNYFWIHFIGIMSHKLFYIIHFNHIFN